MQQPLSDRLLSHPDGPPSRRQTAVTAREQALARVCEGFRTTISPHSAARLADLMAAPAYVIAA
ncbi:hypothetical protein [Streptomyces sp. NBC_00347]|uniref:hypothetical protein n=1 Tax=Streptomyces sp. NBC_00347 TaxID=2975721 RepID=UPI00224D9D3B|nr:hypothetical protein [Streptomyces sp. NBC_00347]MCX5123665.1 hypothetical protein [Streptomyces sp. NBC_00347]